MEVLVLVSEAPPGCGEVGLQAPQLRGHLLKCCDLPSTLAPPPCGQMWLHRHVHTHGGAWPAPVTSLRDSACIAPEPWVSV